MTPIRSAKLPEERQRAEGRGQKAEGSHLAPRKFYVNLTHSTNLKALIFPIKTKKNTLRFIALLLTQPRVIRRGARSQVGHAASG